MAVVGAMPQTVVAGQLQLSVVGLKGETVATMVLPDAASLFEAKRELARRLHLPRFRQRLIFDTAAPPDGTRLQGLPGSATLVQVPYVQDAEAASRLHQAVASGDLQRLEQVLAEPVAPDEDHEGRSAMSVAARAGLSEAMKLLREAGDLRVSGLSEAVTYAGNSEPALLLIGWGAVAQNPAEGYEALRRAVERDKLDVAQALLEAGVDINGEGTDEESLLALSFRYCNLEMASWLRHAGSRPLSWRAVGASMLHYRDPKTPLSGVAFCAAVCLSGLALLLAGMDVGCFALLLIEFVVAFGFGLVAVIVMLDPIPTSRADSDAMWCMFWCRFVAIFISISAISAMAMAGGIEVVQLNHHAFAALLLVIEAFFCLALLGICIWGTYNDAANCEIVKNVRCAFVLFQSLVISAAVWLGVLNGIRLQHLLHPYLAHVQVGLEIVAGVFGILLWYIVSQLSSSLTLCRGTVRQILLSSHLCMPRRVAAPPPLQVAVQEPLLPA